MKKRRQTSKAADSLRLRKAPRITTATDDDRMNPTATRMPEVFQHEPLDQYKPSIRLLRFEDDGETSDRVQCVMRHATIEADYTCLSYRWGNDEPTHSITVNGEAMYIRKNLHDFLTVQKNKTNQSQEKKLVSNPWLWIDALCIDQDNVSERNHQVQQMGIIFARAKQVFIWLGIFDDSLTSILDQGKEGLLQTIKHHECLRHQILANEYWRRAWITQEVILAKQPIVLIHDNEMRLEDLESSIRLSPGSPWEQWDQYVRISQLSWMKSKSYETDFPRKNHSLIQLLWSYRDRECSNPRDRIFSLLSLCDEGQHFRVDYHLPDAELMSETFKHCKDQLCFCNAASVARALELQSMTPAAVDRTPALQPYFEMDVHLLVTGPRTWCQLYTTDCYPRLRDLSDSPGMIFNMFEPCGTFRTFSVYWRIPCSFSEKELVWLEPWTGCPKNLVTVLCEYGKDFNVFKKNGGTDTLEAARQHSSEPGATEVHAVRAKFDDFEALNMRIPDRRPSSSQLLYRRLPHRDAFQQQGLRGSFWEENVKTVEIYTVRMSLAVLAKAPHDGQTFCTMGFGGRNAMDIWRNFDPPRLGYYD